MLMRVLASGLFAVLLASCASGPRLVLPPVRDGTLSGEAGTRAAPASRPGEPETPPPRPASAAPDAAPSTAAAAPEDARPARWTTGGVRAPVPDPGSEDASSARIDEPAPGAGIPALPGEPGSGTGSAAVVALLESARVAEESREYGRAASALERALKVEPRNAGLWHRLAMVRYRQGRHGEVEALARRSLSLAPGDPELASRNWRVIAAARGSRGDEEGALEALRRANALRDPAWTP